MSAFLEQFSRLANVNEIDLLFGDFNINALSKEDYTGAKNDLLDHLYLMRQCLVGKLKNFIVKNIYFPEYDAVKIHNQKESREGIDFTIS